MSSTADNNTTRLRLASARRKVTAFLDQIRHLEASDFAHDDAREALEFIREHFNVRLASLTLLPAKVQDDLVDGVCWQISTALSRYTEVLGFILRSTNVRNAFEIHFPLKRLVRKIVSPDVQLVLSSEWNFVPFTYPMSLDLLPNFVLIGAPATESGNVLTTPLAGHEIGHSVWRTEAIRTKALEAATLAWAAVIAGEQTRFDRLLNDLAALKLNAERAETHCFSSVTRQLEEVFSDVLGLYIFGASYLYAYEYFLAPGSTFRDRGYPSGTVRVAILKETAQELGIAFDPHLFDGWQAPPEKGHIEEEVLFFADEAVSRTVPIVRSLAIDHLKTCGVAPPDSAAIARIRANFAAHVPDGEGGTLPEILCAGWEYLREHGGLARDDQQPEYDMLNELMLKSIEVSEFLLRVKTDA